jgi:hypothetical protein
MTRRKSNRKPVAAIADEPLSAELAVLVAQLEAYGATRGDSFGADMPKVARELARTNPALLRTLAASVRERPGRPQARWEKRGADGALRLDPGGKAETYPEHVAHSLLAENALGTVSQDSFSDLVSSLESVSRRLTEARGASASGLNAALAIMAAVNPADEIEAALGAQMVAAHMVGMDLAGRARHAGLMPHVQAYGALAVKFQRTFVAQVEALAKLRSGGKQQVEVRYVYVNGNAVIGDVHTGAGGGAGQGFDGQAQAPALMHTPGERFPPVWGQDSIGIAMQGAGSAGPRTLPDAWGREGIGSPERGGERAVCARSLDQVGGQGTQVAPPARKAARRSDRGLK